MPEIPPHLHERYGIRPPSRWHWIGYVAAIAAGAFVAVYFVSRYSATQQASASIIEWAPVDGTSITLTFQANAADRDRFCAVRAQDFDQYDVGFVVLPVSAKAQSVTYIMRTLTKPFAVDVVGCNTDPTEIFGPQFAPGVLPPPQDAPGMAPGVWQ